MLDRLDQLAILSVARGVGFASLAVLCVMIAFAGHPAALLKAGGIGALLVTAVLMLKAHGASKLAYRRTEVWLMLEAHERPPDAYAQRLIASARRKALLRFALAAASVGASFLGASVLARLAGLG